MSLYHEAAAVIEAVRNDKSSLKTQVFSRKGWKTDPKTLYALAVEATKWSAVLTEVIEHSTLLKAEKQLTPVLALVLVHDLLLSKKGVALPAKHGLHVAVTRHKSRLTSELTKARIRRTCSSLDELRAKIDAGEDANQGDDAITSARHIRWVRVNSLKTTLQQQLETTFAGFERVQSLEDFMRICSERGPKAKAIHTDDHITNLLAIPASMDILHQSAYRTGQVILQDKASCFPAFLLDPSPRDSHILDSCAAPGNKTTHLAAIITASSQDAPSTGVKSRVTACEKDSLRSETLRKMIKIAGGESVISIRGKQDFMKLDPNSSEFADVTALLLDPSCSGSGIVGRNDSNITVHLPSLTKEQAPPSRSRKRKRAESVPAAQTSEGESPVEEVPIETQTKEQLQERLKALSSFQLRLVERAMSFPAAQRITYSTCSVHGEENEQVVCRALSSDVARQRGWRILRRADQVDGLRRWQRRGWVEACQDMPESTSDEGLDSIETIADACIRCEKGTSDGTMGFFVAAFVRSGAEDKTVSANGAGDLGSGQPDSESDGEWHGFDD